MQISRVSGTAVFPARFMLVCAMNPCKCGWYGYSDRCRCSPQAVEKYLSRLSGPPCWTASTCSWRCRHWTLTRSPAGPRREPLRRHQGPGGRGPGGAGRPLRPRRPGLQRPDGPGGALPLLRPGRRLPRRDEGAFDRMGLTARSYDRILRVARTIADLDGAGAVAVEHLAEALQYRPPEYLRR